MSINKEKEIKHPRMTKKNAEIMKVILDNEKEIKCTLNHKFMLKNGSYKEAKDLMPDDSLMPAYFRISTKLDDPNAVGYNMILQPNLQVWNFVHVLSDEWNISNDIYTKSAGRIRHNIDFSKLNNNPNNIRRIGWKEHWKLHYELTSQKHKTDAEYVKKLAQGRKAYWSNAENRKKHSEILSSRNKNNWKKQSYRSYISKKFSDGNKAYYKNHPEKRIELSERATKTLKRLWQTPEYRELFHDKIIASNKRRLTNLTGKRKFLKICTYLKEKNLPLNKENYERVRKSVFGLKSFTSWELGISKYYSNDSNLVICEINENHKVLGIEFLKESVNVFDLTIDKTHNFALSAGIFVHNSIDGDPAAAMRYSECRLTRMAEEMLEDIDKRTVRFIPNFDNSTTEPVVLPSKLPNLLLNGSTGIAVGMATNISPHNISEIIDGILLVLENPSLDIIELMKVIKGPDFPTGAIINGRKGIEDYYKTGKGRLIVRAKTEIEDNKIIVKEIPYQVNKSLLIEGIANLVRNGIIGGIKDIRDESDKTGIRVIIHLKKDEDPKLILNQLYKHSGLQNTFGVIMLALVNNEPRILNFKEIIENYILHRKDVVIKRTNFDLNKTLEKEHILEGLKIALSNIDKVIELIKKSEDTETAKLNLISNFSLSERQSVAILEMRLQRLTRLETGKINEDLLKAKQLIEELRGILASEQKVIEIIRNELIELKNKYSDKRRTQIVEEEAESFVKEELIKEENIVVTLTYSGYIKQVPLTSYKQQRRGGKGIQGTSTKDEEDIVKNLLVTSNLNTLLFFTNKGKE